MEKRLNVLPTRMQMQALKARRTAAMKGWKLLKKKVEALTVSFHKLQQRIYKEKLAMCETVKLAHWSLTRVRRSTGDLSTVVQQCAGPVAVMQTIRKIENIAGVRLPSFTLVNTSEMENQEGEENGSGENINNNNVIIGISRGGALVKEARNAWAKALEDMVRVASMQASYLALEHVLRVTSRRVNALEYVVIPRTTNTIRYISDELEEQEHDDTFRLKLISKKKQRAKDEEEIAAKKRIKDANAREEAELLGNTADITDENNKDIQKMMDDTDEDISKLKGIIEDAGFDADGDLFDGIF